MFFMLVPTVISVFLAIQVRTILDQQSTAAIEEQIVCFTESQCAIQVNGVWYQINGVINMTETIPEEYLPEPEDEIVPDVDVVVDDAAIE
jgi:hypothetical protein